MFDTPLISNDQSIDRVLKAGLPVALVFLDGEARPGLDTAMGRLAREQAGKLLLIKVYVKDSPGVASRYSVSQTPAVVTVRNQEIVSKAEAASEGELEKHVAYLLGNEPKPESAPRAARAGASQARQQAGGPGQPVVVTDATFDEAVLRSSEPVLVDFWAPWCGPCRMIEPTVEHLANENAGRLKVAKVNVDQNPGLSARYGVQSIPTMMMVKNGQIVERWMGAMPEPALRSKVMRWLAN